MQRRSSIRRTSAGDPKPRRLPNSIVATAKMGIDRSDSIETFDRTSLAGNDDASAEDSINPAEFLGHRGMGGRPATPQQQHQWHFHRIGSMRDFSSSTLRATESDRGTDTNGGAAFFMKLPGQLTSWARQGANHVLHGAPAGAPAASATAAVDADDEI